MKQALTALEITHLSIGELRPDPANPRRISDEELESLTRSIQEFGLIDPIIARREDKVVIGGHQRLLAARKLGMKKVQLNSTLFDGPLHVVGNANQIEQVLLNLFMNAGDAMEADGGGTLTVTTDRVDGAIRIKSTDTGCGIPADVKRKIFDPFFTTKPVGKGTGLGLSVSYGIIQEHKGEITVDSEIGKGTTFTITIPLAPPSTEDPITDKPKEEKRVRVISLR